MAYIGLPPKANFTSGLLDRFTSTTGTTVTLTHDIASENDIVVFVNFVKQDSTTYSVGGTGNKTLTLGGTLVSSDIVEVHYLNIVGQTVAPSSGSVGSSQLTTGAVTGAKLNTDVISAQTELATAPADTDEFLVSDAGVLKRIDYSLIKGGGIDMVDQYSLTADHSGDSVITSNLARSSHTAFGRIGTGMSESSGIFTFPSTGIYLIIPKIVFRTDNNGDRTMTCYTEVTTDNSSYTNVDAIFSGDEDSGGLAVNSTCSSFCLIDVTDTSNVKVRFRTESIDANLEGAENTYNMTSFTFIRLGDT